MTKRYKDRMKPSVYGIGYVGNGEYVTRKGSVHTTAYDKWHGILERCYSPNASVKHPSYRDCYICDEWMNFQVFAKWFYENYPDDGISYHIDKDIKVKGNKVYSPSTCLFVTPEDNGLEARGCLGVVRGMISPVGVLHEFTSQRAFAKEHGLDNCHISHVLNGERLRHKGWTAA